MKKELDKNYSPKDIEDRLYTKWMDRGYFHAEVNPDKKPYTIVIPPPNITGQLHMGHALDNTLQDILIRFKRMQGYEALWMPGTDHASIATEAKIVEAMKAEGVTKDDIGREGFLERAWDWRNKFGSRIVSQLKKMGSSCDWERERFTMDEGCSKAVKEVFVNLYEKGLIYRGKRIINWCPNCLTTISDAEVDYEDQKGHFWHLRYAFSDGSGYINLATTRPETLLGDTAVAVNPKDERYKDLVGKTLILPLVNREIPLIADDYVDMEFGTGVVKITPAHDPNDFEVGARHNLEIINVLTPDAKIVDDYPDYAGMDRYEARKKIVEDLEKCGALIKTEEHDHNVGTCYRCGTTVEPRVSKQWFVKMKPLAGPAIDAVKNGETNFVPKHFEKTYFHWLNNIRDWCISRQLWWGHRIPAFYCDDCGEMVVTKSDEVPVCPHCGKPMTQDPDTLDTWFSSALWPFSVMGWPDKTPEMDYFYPTNTLVTGYDIIPFWVMRMMFSGIEHTGQVPFDTVLIHGLVRDSQGRKMSKSLGNGIDPLEVIDKYGADALRFSLVTGNAPGNDMRFYWERVESSRNFANKVWNASRFIMMNMDANADLDYSDVDADSLAQADKWILAKVNKVIGEVTAHIENFDLGIALSKINDFIWEEFCDWYIEMVKPRFYNNDDVESKKAALYTLNRVLIDSLKMLHPFMPFVTEEIYCTLKGTDETSIMIQPWPEYSDVTDENTQMASFVQDMNEVEKIKETVKRIRNLRGEMNVPVSKRVTIYVVPEDVELKDALNKNMDFFSVLAYASEVHVLEDNKGIDENSVSLVIDGGTVYMPFEELVDIKAELERLNKEKAKLEGELKRSKGMLGNEKFISKAPEKKIAEERAKLEKYENMMENVLKQIEVLSGR